jgi:hypothetical protein
LAKYQGRLQYELKKLKLKYPCENPKTEEQEDYLMRKERLTSWRLAKKKGYTKKSLKKKVARKSLV